MDEQNFVKEQSFFNGFEDRAHLIRFCIACCVLCSLLLLSLGSVAFLLRVWGIVIEGNDIKVSAVSDKRVAITEIDATSEGISFKTANGGSVNSLIVPANKLWLNTNIFVPSGATISIGASGSITLDTSRILQLSRDPLSLPIEESKFIVGPDGKSLNEREVNERQVDKLRGALSVYPDKPPGTLLAVVLPESSQPPNRNNPRPNGIVPVGNRTQFKYRNPSDTGGILYLTVNDFIATSRSEDKNQWLLKTEDPQQWEQRIRESYREDFDTVVQGLTNRWDSIVQAEMWEAFFEDNTGYLLVSVEISTD